MQALGSLWKGKQGRLEELDSKTSLQELSSGKVEAELCSTLEQHVLETVLKASLDSCCCSGTSGLALSKFLHALSFPPAFPPGMGCLPGLEEEEVWCYGVTCAWSPLLPLGLLCPAMAPVGASPHNCAPSSNK